LADPMRPAILTTCQGWILLGPVAHS
jgi:hypothetical protein